MSRQDDHSDLEKLAEEQYLSPWPGPGEAASQRAAADDPEDDARRDEHGDYLFESDRRAAEERKAAVAEGEDAGDQGSIFWLVVFLGIIFVLVGMLFLSGPGPFSN